MKIIQEKNTVDFVPENDEEFAALNSLWQTIIDCNDTSSHLTPIGEFVPGKSDKAQFVIEK